MFLRVFVFVVLFVLPLQVTCGFDASYVDSIVDYCQKKVSQFKATERKYVKSDNKPEEAVLTGQPIPELLHIGNVVEQNQRVFECIGNLLNNYYGKNLEESCNYQNLVEKCKSERPITPQCDALYPYRTMNATCNNLGNPIWGSTLSCQQRIFPANYERSSGIRKSVSGKRLPQPRILSLNIVKPRQRPSTGYNSLLVFFGQAVAHQLVDSSFSTIDGSTVLDCCKYARTKEQHPQCAPLLFRPNDPFYSDHNISCLGFDRLTPCHTCSVGKRFQMNQATSYIDCSLTYGQYDERAKNLRRNDGSGKLLSQYREAGELMPGYSNIGTAKCGRDSPEKEQYCFRSGDTRTNQHTVISMLQTLLLREHNRIAEKLKMLNPHWDEEQLYQESRKILIAEFQVITFSEFLPVLLGQKLMSKYDLNIASGKWYDSEVDASMSIEFSAAAFRIHSLIPGKVVSDEEYEHFSVLYSNAAPVYNGRTSAYLSKIANRPAEEYGCNMPIDLTDFLYRTHTGTYGYDLAAVDIQRGRDTGLPTYSQVIEYLEDRPGTIKSFSDLDDYLIPECRKILEENYYDVRDIDLWLGLNCERIPDDMIISPTAAEIIAEQFRRLKYGDRFYFEFDDTFTYEQLESLLNASLAKLICDNSYVFSIQPLAMLFPSVENMPTCCSNIPGVDLEKWQECTKEKNIL